MAHGRAARAVHVSLAADVRRDNQVPPRGFERIERVVAQCRREFGLRQRIGAGRAAARMAIGDIRQIEAEPRQDAFDRAAEALRVLQRARAVDRDAAVRRIGQRVERLVRSTLRLEGWT